MTEFEQIYRAYFQDVELYLRAISHDESLAEELTEQVFFQALNALPKFRGDCDIRTWLCSMARNAYLSHLRKERPSQPIDELEISDPKQAVEEQIMDAQQAMAVHRVLHDAVAHKGGEPDSRGKDERLRGAECRVVGSDRSGKPAERA